MADNKSREGQFVEGIRNVKRIEHDASESFKKLNEQARSIGELTAVIDIPDALKGMKAVQREARKATAALKEFEEQQKKDKYLVIELDELGDVPKVFYKGVEVHHKEFINFQWATKTGTPGHTDIIVDYFEENDMGYPEEKSIRKGVSS